LLATDRLRGSASPAGSDSSGKPSQKFLVFDRPGHGPVAVLGPRQGRGSSAREKFFPSEKICIAKKRAGKVLSFL